MILRQLVALRRYLILLVGWRTVIGRIDEFSTCVCTRSATVYVDYEVGLQSS